MKGIKLTIPYRKHYSQIPDETTRAQVAKAIESAKKSQEPIDLDMLLLVVKSPEKPTLGNVLAHIFSKAAERGEVNPAGIFADWKKSPDNLIEIHAHHSYFI